MGGKWRARGLRVLTSSWHPRQKVDPFGFFPCTCQQLLVHVTTGKRLGEDMVECPEHQVVATLGELFRHLRPPA